MPVDHQALKRGAKGALEVPRARSSSQLRHGGAAVPNEQLSQEAPDASCESSVKVTLAFKLNELLVLAVVSPRANLVARPHFDGGTA